jgi:hypothetical protein
MSPRHQALFARDWTPADAIRFCFRSSLLFCLIGPFMRLGAAGSGGAPVAPPPERPAIRVFTDDPGAGMPLIRRALTPATAAPLHPVAR